MILNRQDVNDRNSRDIPLTAFGLDDEEFDEIYAKLADDVDLRETQITQTEYFVLCHEKKFQRVYDQYGVIGGDIFFQRGPLASGDPSGQLPPEWQPRPKES